MNKLEKLKLQDWRNPNKIYQKWMNFLEENCQQVFSR